jgi:hypothetical protein
MQDKENNMSNHYDYVYEDENEIEQTIEVHYEYIPGHKGKLNGPPEDCYEAEGPEIDILYFMNPKTGNEILDEELDVSVNDIIDAILEYHEGDTYED